MCVPLAGLLVCKNDTEAMPHGYAALQRILGVTLLERAARQMAQVNIRHFVILAPVIAPEISRIAEQLLKQGLTVELARDAIGAAQFFHPDERIILVDASIMLGEAELADVAAERSAMILTVNDGEDRDRFERMGHDMRWRGVMAFQASLLRETTAELGEWELSSTLLRILLQKKAALKPIEIKPGQESFLKPEGQDEAMRVGVNALSRFTDNDKGNDAHNDSGAFNSFFAEPLIKRFHPVLAKGNISYSILEISFIILLILSFIFSFLKIQSLSYIVFACATLLISAARLIRRASAQDAPSPLKWQALAPYALVPLILFQGGALADFAVFSVPVLLAIWVCVQWGLLKYFHHLADTSSNLTCDAGAIAIVLGLSALVGFPVFGLTLVLFALIWEHIQTIKQIKSA
jgi:hypothetical protein